MNFWEFQTPNSWEIFSSLESLQTARRRSAEEIRSDAFGPPWLTKAFHTVPLEIWKMGGFWCRLQLEISIGGVLGSYLWLVCCLVLLFWLIFLLVFRGFVPFFPGEMECFIVRLTFLGGRWVWLSWMGFDLGIWNLEGFFDRIVCLFVVSLWCLGFRVFWLLGNSFGANMFCCFVVHVWLVFVVDVIHCFFFFQNSIIDSPVDY